jgi:hypothetical protein
LINIKDEEYLNLKYRILSQFIKLVKIIKRKIIKQNKIYISKNPYANLYHEICIGVSSINKLSQLSFKSNSKNILKRLNSIYQKISSKHTFYTEFQKTLHIIKHTKGSYQKDKPKKEESQRLNEGQGPTLPPPLCPGLGLTLGNWYLRTKI